MRKVLSLALAVMLLLSLAACKSGGRGRSDNIIDGSGAPKFSRPSSDGGEHTSPESPAAGEQLADVGSEVRGVWLSYLELTGLMKGKSEHEFRMGLAKVLDTCADFGLNTVILQVRPYGDAIYPSEIFPQSYLFTGEEGSVGKAPYDALAISVEEAHKRKLRLEAWINPYRVRAKADLPLSADNPAVDMLQSGDAIKLGELISYNPASAAAQALIVAGITEIVESYDVDGIHFDDYFYPVTDESFDRRDYSAYKASGGAKDLAAWRRGNVTALVRKVHDAIEITKPSVRLGISPQGNIDNNLNKQFVDIEELIKAGLIDYICPQMYYGFNNDTCPYVATIKMFNHMAKGTPVKVYAGLATYKFGTADSWAGDGKDEWLATTDILSRQVSAARDLSCYGGFVLYRYDSTFNYQDFFAGDKAICLQAENELANLKKLFYR